MRTIAITSLMLVLIAGLSGAQGMFQPPKPEADSFQAYTPITGKGLFDPSRFSMSNSYSMSFISNGHQSIYQNLYVNSSRYQISKSLSLNLDLGYSFSPLAQSSTKNGTFLPNAELNYRPNDHFLIQMSYHTIDPFYYGYGYQRYPWYR